MVSDDLENTPSLMIAYAVHAFVAENPDELSFEPGEVIEVVETDEQYSDGWWQGRNSRGEIGLFPQSYTRLTPLPGASEANPGKSRTAPNSTTILPSGVHSKADPDATPMPDTGRMAQSAAMHETLSQLQHAIDQMQIPDQVDPSRFVTGDSSPRRSASIRSARPRSLASKHSEQSLASISDNGSEMGDANWDSQDYTKARALLAQKAKENAEAKVRKAQSQQAVVHVPEVGVMELSDESDDEDVDAMRQPQNVPLPDSVPTSPMPPAISMQGMTLRKVSEDERETEGSEVEPRVADVVPKQLPLNRPPTPLYPQPNESEMASEPSGSGAHLQRAAEIVETPQALSRRSSFNGNDPVDTDHNESNELASTFVAQEPSKSQHSQDSQDAEESRAQTSQPLLAPAAALVGAAAATFSSSSLKPDEAELHESSTTRRDEGSGSGSPEPTMTMSHARASSQQLHSLRTENSSRASSWLPGDHSSRATTADGDAISPISSNFQKHEALPADPSTWTVDQVVEWGREKRFDDFTLGKLAEHQITGDVLLDLDVNNLKEVDLTAFGRRMRVSKAIEELKRSQGILSPTAILTAPTAGAGAGAGAGVDVGATHPNTCPIPQGKLHHHQSDVVLGLRSPLTMSSLGHHFGAVNASPTSPLAHPSTPDSMSGAQHQQYSPTAIAYLTQHDQHLSDVVGSPSVHQPAQLKGLGLAEQDESLQRSGSQRSGSLAAASPKKRHPREASEASSESFKSLGDDRGTMSDSEVKLRGKRGLHSKSASLSQSVQSSVSVPPSPDTTQPPRSRTPKASFLGTLRGRKPPPKEPSLSPIDDGYKAGEFANLRSSSTTTYASHRLSTRIFPFTHQTVTTSYPHQRQPLKSTISQPWTGDDNKATFADTLSSATSHSKKAKSPTSMVGGGGKDEEGEEGSRMTNPLEQIGRPDHSGWMRKRGEKYPTWKLRYFVLKGTNLYYLKSETETKLKGHIRLSGFRIIMDADVNPGRYGFRIVNDTKSPIQTHSFSSEDSKVVREWMKAIMKATIGRDWTAPVISSYNMDVISIAEAQQMFPPPRPPSPTSRSRVQKALLPANPDVLTEKDAAVLMSFTPNHSRSMQRANTDAGAGLRPQRSTKRKTVTSTPTSSTSAQQLQPQLSVSMRERTISGPISNAPISPSAQSTKSLPVTYAASVATPSLKSGGGGVGGGGADDELLNWINRNLPPHSPRAENVTTAMSSGQLITRLVESVTGTQSGLNDDQFAAFNPNEPLSNIDVLFSVFDYLNNQDIPLEGYSLNDLIKGEPVKTRRFLTGIRQKFA